MPERNYREFIGVFTDEDNIISDKQEESAYVTIDMNSVCAWNQCVKNTTTVDIQGGVRYRIDMEYPDFCKLMKEIN